MPSNSACPTPATKSAISFAVYSRIEKSGKGVKLLNAGNECILAKSNSFCPLLICLYIGVPVVIELNLINGVALPPSSNSIFLDLANAFIAPIEVSNCFLSARIEGIPAFSDC